MDFLEFRWDSRVSTGNSGFLLCWPRKSNLPFELPGRAVDWAPFTEGQTRPHLGLYPGLNVPLHRRQGFGVAFHTHPGSQASSRGEAKDSTLFSSRDRYLLEPTEWSLLCRRALVYISLYISEHRHSVCMLLRTQNRATRSLMLSMRRGSCAATQQLKNPTNCSFLTSDRARIAVALGSLKTLDPNPCQSRPGF